MIIMYLYANGVDMLNETIKDAYESTHNKQKNNLLKEFGKLSTTQVILSGGAVGLGLFIIKLITAKITSKKKNVKNDNDF